MSPPQSKVSLVEKNSYVQLGFSLVTPVGGGYG